MDTVRLRLVRDHDRDVALSELVAAASGLEPPTIGRHCPWCGSATHGRPVVHGSGPPVSLARAGSACLVAVGQTRAIGVDLEHAGSVDARALAAAGIEHSPGLDPTVAWVRAEAIGKARGTGLAPHVAGPAVTVIDLRPAAGLVAAVAASGPDRFALRFDQGTVAARGRGATGSTTR